MKQDKKKTNEGTRSTSETDTVNHNKVNPFKEPEVSEDKQPEAIEQDNAIAEQQRKEALTERD